MCKLNELHYILVCREGHGYSNGNCIPCALGKYKSSIADAVCNNCQYGKTTEQEGQTSSASCSKFYTLILTRSILIKQ